MQTFTIAAVLAFAAAAVPAPLSTSSDPLIALQIKSQTQEQGFTFNKLGQGQSIKSSVNDESITDVVIEISIDSVTPPEDINCVLLENGSNTPISGPSFSTTEGSLPVHLAPTDITNFIIVCSN
jgi:hypothetical protein